MRRSRIVAPQLVGVPRHTPAEQASPVVQALLSLHTAVLLVWPHPEAGLQVSSVQTFPSSQFGAAPPRQTPPLHASFVVQALLSLHAAVLLAWPHPDAGLQASVVHTFPSSQFGAAPPRQLPPLHASFVVQALLSLHSAVLFVCVHPVGVHPSSVQGLPSSQFNGLPETHTPPLQRSFAVQGLLSEHGTVLFVCPHPDAGSHVSFVQTLPSSQLSPAPPRQMPPLHRSFVVHALPSLQGATLLACVHPEFGLHASSVHTLPSSQFGAAPPRQIPPMH